MSPSLILDKSEAAEIQAAMGIALLRLKNNHHLTLDAIGHIMGRSKQSVSQYISGLTEMEATCWIKATAKWPELNDMLLAELDVAEKQAAARQRAFKLEQAA